MYYQLGATLYVSANRTDLNAILLGEKLANLRSIVLCTEDSVDVFDLPLCLQNIKSALTVQIKAGLLVFIRPRSPQLLQFILDIANIDKVSGFVLPKLDEGNISIYQDILRNHANFSIMPILETAIAFERTRIIAFGQALQCFNNYVVCVRIGGNDLFALLGIRHPKDLTIYDTPLRTVIDNILICLRPMGIEVSAPVCDYYNHSNILEKELKLDKAYGFFAKTAIHPQQIDPIHQMLSVTAEQLYQADTLLSNDCVAIFGDDGGMCERATHRAWAKRLVRANHQDVARQQSDINK